MVSVHEPWNTYPSGKACIRAASRTVKYRTEPSGRTIMFSPPGTP